MSESSTPIELRPIDRDNVRAVIGLKVRPDQEQFVANNATSLAQAYVHEEVWPRAIYVDDRPVGFVMLEVWPALRDVGIWRFMIDAEHQRKGYGRAALEQVIEHAQRTYDASEVFLSHQAGEGSPGPFYERCGFVYTGKVVDGEHVMTRVLDDRAAYFLVQGTPATFATAGEKAWKEALAAAAPEPSLDGHELTVECRLTVAELAPRGRPRDLDNFMEPVLSALVNQRGWFGGTRTKLRGFSAIIEEGSDVGGAFGILPTFSSRPLGGSPIFDGTYRGPLPTSGAAPEIPAWLGECGDVPAAPASAGVYLGFGTFDVNVGDIATGPVKSVIDCLYPILGGKPSAPQDHIITQLVVEKGAHGVPEDGVQIRVHDVS